MKLTDVDYLHCPFCGSEIKIINISNKNSLEIDKGVIEYGILGCACSKYPIVYGIPIIQRIEGISDIISHIENGLFKKAILQAMKLFRIRWAQRTKLHKYYYYLNCQKLINNNDIYFEDALNLARKPKVFSDYLLHRYANSSFIGGVIILQLIEEILSKNNEKIIKENKKENKIEKDKYSNKKYRILDLACGAGHSSFMIDYFYPEISINAADTDFISLYLAKRFMANDINYICYNSEYPSPYPDNHFNSVFCLDAFHYFNSKKAILAELNRILKPESLWLFPHLHNALENNIVPGVPLSPEMYLKCFSFIDARIYDESELIKDNYEKQILNLDKKYDINNFKGCSNLTLIAGPQSIWKKHEMFNNLFRKEDLKLYFNPIYKIRKKDNKLCLDMKWPNLIMKKECKAIEKIIPKKLCFEIGKEKQFYNYEEIFGNKKLIKFLSKFVLVPLPNKYSRNIFKIKNN